MQIFFTDIDCVYNLQLTFWCVKCILLCYDIRGFMKSHVKMCTWLSFSTGVQYHLINHGYDYSKVVPVYIFVLYQITKVIFNLKCPSPIIILTNFDKWWYSTPVCNAVHDSVVMLFVLSSLYYVPSYHVSEQAAWTKQWQGHHQQPAKIDNEIPWKHFPHCWPFVWTGPGFNAVMIILMG